jgi:protein-tyrosine-phosphatase
MTMKIKNQKVEQISALDVQDGDIILMYGYRCRASRCTFHANSDGVVVKRFALTSEPNKQFPDTLPGGFNGGVYGGSKMAIEYREVAAR